MSIMIEKKKGLTCVSWTLNLYDQSVKRTQTFQLNNFQNYHVSSQVPSYEVSWMLRNMGYWSGFNPLNSQHIKFHFNEVDFCNKETGAIPDCYLQPQAVWVTVDGGQFQEDSYSMKIGKVILTKATCDSDTMASNGSWKSERVIFTPQTEKRFTFHFFIQFKNCCFSQRNAIEQISSYLFLQQINCDVQFRFTRSFEKIGAHQSILSARSPVFASMFHENMKESNASQFVIDVGRNIFYQLLHFIYCGRTSEQLTENNAKRLLAAAAKYNIEDLKDECANFLLPYVTETNAQKMFEMATHFEVENLKEECEHVLLHEIQMNNVLDLIIWADSHSAKNTKEAALNFSAANFKTIAQSYDFEKMMRMHPDICLQVTRRMTITTSE
jgi:hypothetical protein